MKTSLHGLAVLACGLLIGNGASFAAPPPCTPVFDAYDKVMATPVHMYTTEGKNSKPLETIYDKAIYTGMEGKWNRSSITLEQVKNNEVENRKKSKFTCAFVKNEQVNGEDAILYKVRSENPETIADTQIWISKKGLPLRTESDIENKGKSKTHYSVKYDYKNVAPPKI